MSEQDDMVTAMRDLPVMRDRFDVAKGDPSTGSGDPCP
jgi:hypothetical protein